MDPLVSVTICSFNAEKYISKTLASICNQSYKNLEIVVVDDGSTDNTISILKQFQEADNRINIFNRAHQGQARAKNECIKLSSGEWIANLDHDDICYPTRIEEQVRTSKKYPEADVIFSGTDIIDEDDNFIREYRSSRYISKLPSFIKKVDAANYLLRYGCFITASSFFGRKDAVKRAGELDSSLLYALDYDLFIRLGMICNFAQISKSLLGWRIHRNQMTKISSAKTKNNELLKIYSKYLNSKQINNFTKIIMLLRMTRYYINTLSKYS